MTKYNFVTRNNEGGGGFFVSFGFSFDAGRSCHSLKVFLKGARGKLFVHKKFPPGVYAYLVPHKVAQGAEYGAFALAFAACFGGVGEDAVGQAGEGKALQPYGAVSTQVGHEEAFSTEEHGFHVAGALNVVFDAAGEGGNAAGVDGEAFAFELFLDDGAAYVDEGHAVAGEFLQDEPFSSEEACAQAFGEGNAYFCAHGCAEEGVFLAEQFAAQVGEVHGDNFTGVGGCKSDAAFAGHFAGEMREEDAFAGEHAFTHVEEFAHHAFVGIGAVAHFGFVADALFHIVHGAGFGDDGFAGIEFHFDDLHIVADNFIVDFVTLHAFSPVPFKV